MTFDRFCSEACSTTITHVNVVGTGLPKQVSAVKVAQNAGVAPRYGLRHPVVAEIQGIGAPQSGSREAVPRSKPCSWSALVRFDLHDVD